MTAPAPTRRPPTSPGTAARTVSRWSVAAAGVALIVVLEALFVSTAAGQSLDDRVMRWMLDTFDPRAAERLLGLVSPAVLLLLTFAVAGLALLTDRSRPLLRAGVVLAVAASVTIAGQVLKAAIERPDLWGWTTGNSFPSGHVAAVAGIGAALVVAVPAVARGWAVYAALAACAVASAAVVMAGWHRPSDAVASVLLGVVGACLGLLAVERGGRSR